MDYAYNASGALFIWMKDGKGKIKSPHLVLKDR